MKRVGLSMTALVGATIVGTGCADTTTGAGDSPEFALSTLRIRQAAPTMAAQETAAGWTASAADVAGSIDPTDIVSLTVTITRVDYLPVGEDDGTGEGEGEGEGDDTDDGGWESLILGEEVTLDLMALPAEGESPIVIAAGMVPVGDYRKVRLFLSSAEIMFGGPVAVGGAASFDADTPYPVDVPSAANTGIKTDVSFSVTADGNGDANAVDVLFDPSTTFANVTATGNGRVKMAPVLKGAN